MGSSRYGTRIPMCLRQNDITWCRLRPGGVTLNNIYNAPATHPQPQPLHSAITPHASAPLPLQLVPPGLPPSPGAGSGQGLSPSNDIYNAQATHPQPQPLHSAITPHASAPLPLQLVPPGLPVKASHLKQCCTCCSAGGICQHHVDGPVHFVSGVEGDLWRVHTAAGQDCRVRIHPTIFEVDAAAMHGCLPCTLQCNTHLHAINSLTAHAERHVDFS